jgi:hypothetical protein
MGTLDHPNMIILSWSLKQWAKTYCIPSSTPAGAELGEHSDRSQAPVLLPQEGCPVQRSEAREHVGY